MKQKQESGVVGHDIDHRYCEDFKFGTEILTLRGFACAGFRLDGTRPCYCQVHVSVAE